MFVFDENEKLLKEGPKLAVAWIDLTFYGQSLFKRTKKPILNGISGSVDFGTLTALMGPSGAGKTTLLKCINGRIKNYNGMNIYLSADKDVKSCFIVQEVSDHLFKGLTSFQALIYASKLKNIGKECDHEMNARKVMSDLLIENIEKTLVEKCSGGEQKRLVIAQELMAIDKPNLLCIDEPTSGLDSNAAEIVIQCLKEVSQKHCIAVVTSIHQPNNDVFMYFDGIYVLAKGGICIYDGCPRDLDEQLRLANIECKPHQFPIELVIKIASVKNENIDALFALTKTNQESLVKRCLTEGRLSPQGVTHKGIGFELRHFMHLFLRSSTCMFQSNWKKMILQFIFVITMISFATNLFNKYCGRPDGCFTLGGSLGNKSISRIEAMKIDNLVSQNFKLQFFTEILLQFLLLFSTVLLFAPEVRVFFNEHKNGWYSTSSYYWAKTLVELPFLIVVTLCYALIAYEMSHQIDENFRLLSYIAISLLSMLCSQGMAFFIGIISDTNEKIAMVLIIGIYLIFLMLCGFLAPLDELPQWLPQISFIKQGFENRLITIYGFDRCPEEQLVLYRINVRGDTDQIFKDNCILMIIYLVLYRITALLVLIIKSNPIIFEMNQLFRKKKEIYHDETKNGTIHNIV